MCLTEGSNLRCFVEGSDEGIGGMSAGESEEQSMEELKAEVVNLRVQLDRERRLRISLEERNRDLEARLYPSKMAHHVQAQIRYQDHMPQVNIYCSTWYWSYFSVMENSHLNSCHIFSRRQQNWMRNPVYVKFLSQSPSCQSSKCHSSSPNQRQYQLQRRLLLKANQCSPQYHNPELTSQAWILLPLQCLVATWRPSLKQFVIWKVTACSLILSRSQPSPAETFHTVKVRARKRVQCTAMRRWSPRALDATPLLSSSLTTLLRQLRYMSESLFQFITSTPLTLQHHSSSVLSAIPSPPNCYTVLLLCSSHLSIALAL